VLSHGLDLGLNRRIVPIFAELLISGVELVEQRLLSRLGGKRPKIVSGKIADEELGKPGNVYTRALNDGLVLKVIAQPTMKEGKINRLFITHAELSQKELV
jgi:hypothetical protein